MKKHLLVKRKVIAIIIAFIYLVLSIFGGGEVFSQVLISVTFALILILFSDEMSHYRGFLGRIGSKVTKGSPPGMIEFMGWFFYFYL